MARRWHSLPLHLRLLLRRASAVAARAATQSAACQIAVLAVLPFFAVSALWWALGADLLVEGGAGQGPAPCAGGPAPATELLRVCIVASSFQGVVTSSGIGTFYSALGEALVVAGHSVTLLFTQGNVSHSVEGDFDYWRAQYMQKGIEMVPLPKLQSQVEGVMYHAKTAWSVYRWLRERSHLFDVVHVHDYQGYGYYTVLAKYLRIAFNTTTVVVMTHGPLRWARTANGQQLDTLLDAEVDFLEQQTVRLADIVLSPSEYLLRWAKMQGWIPRTTPQVMPLLVPTEARKRLEQLAAAAGAADSSEPRRIDELVFFGRLEGRKGIVEFCDAVDTLLERGGSRLSKVAFLGGSASTILGMPSREYLLPRTDAWRRLGVEVEIVDDRDTGGALTYLLGGGGRRCAVLPSRSENSPMAVTELLTAKVPFLASNVGGIPELIAPESHSSSMFHANNVTALAEAIARALDQGVAVARAARALGDLETSWLQWHRQQGRGGGGGCAPPRPAWQAAGRLRGAPMRIAGGGQAAQKPSPSVVAVVLHSTQRPADLRATVLSLLDQDPGVVVSTCMVLVGTVTEDSERVARLLSEGLQWRGVLPRPSLVWAMRRSDGIRECAAARASSLVLLLEAGAVLETRVVGTMASSLVDGDGGITTAAHPYGGEVKFDECSTPRDVRAALKSRGGRTRLFLGPALRAGLFGNVFGGDVVLLSPGTLRELAAAGSLGEGRGFWEPLAAAAVKGLEVQAVPEPLYWMRVVRSPPHSMSDLRRLLRPLRHNFSSAELREVLKSSQQGVASIMGASGLPMSIVEY